VHVANLPRVNKPENDDPSIVAPIKLTTSIAPLAPAITLKLELESSELGVFGRAAMAIRPLRRTVAADSTSFRHSARNPVRVRNHRNDARSVAYIVALPDAA
jgi:hypothetical protein